jgi:hypothetical protein
MYWERYVLGWPKKQAQKWHLFSILGWAGSLMWYFLRDAMDKKKGNRPDCSSHGKGMATIISWTSHSISKQ